MTAHSWTLLAILAAGLSTEEIAESLEKGAGNILGDVGITLAFGAMLGRSLSASGATDRIARSIVDRAGERATPSRPQHPACS